MNFLIILLLVAFSLGNIAKLPILRSEVSLSFFDLGVIAVWMVYLIKYKFNIFKLINFNNGLLYSIVVFILIAIISLVINRDNVSFIELLVGLSYILRWSAYSLLFVPIQRLFSFEVLHKTFYLLIIGFLATGYLQYFFVPDIRPLEIFNWDPHLYRLVGSLLDPGFTAIIFVLSIIYIKLDSLRGVQVKSLFWLLLFVGLMLTYSRAGYLAFIVSTVFISLKIKSLKYLLVSILLFIFAINILPRPGGEGVKLERTSSIAARLINYTQSIQIFSTSPAFGVGFNLYRYAQREEGILDSNWSVSHSAAGADSSLLFVLATTGIVGFLVYIQYICSIFRLKSLLISSSLVAILSHSVFLNSLFYPAVLIFISLLIAHFNLFTNRVSGSVSSNKD